MRRFAALILAGALSSCATSGPSVMLSDGSKILAPTSWLENSQYEEYTYEVPGKFKVTAKKVGKNQSLAISQLLMLWKLPNILKSVMPSGTPTASAQGLAGLGVGGAAGYMVAKPGSPAPSPVPVVRTKAP